MLDDKTGTSGGFRFARKKYRNSIIKIKKIPFEIKGAADEKYEKRFLKQDSFLNGRSIEDRRGPITLPLPASVIPAKTAGVPVPVSSENIPYTRSEWHSKPGLVLQ
ncbi:MAG: hypothetical protein P8J33_10490 [Pirellulaceae bacterium]|nr:hypothetical protein [Pirellulaceae bacterium]